MYANQIYICTIPYCGSPTYFLTIIVSIKKTVLILELRTLMEGEYLFCLQEYRYCFTSNKIWFTNISSSHPIIPNRISLSEWTIFNLDFMVKKAFYNLRPEIPLSPPSSMSLIRVELLTLPFPFQIKSKIIWFASFRNSLSNDIKLVRYKKIGIIKVLTICIYLFISLW